MESVKLGVISDVQYCDCDNLFRKGKERFYRNAINHLDNAINYFLHNSCTTILQLGDLIDGMCKWNHSTDNAMELMEQRFDSDKFETFHVIGNHELSNLSRERLWKSFIGNSLRKYQKKKQDVHYYKVDLSSDICLIVLDCYEISLMNKRDSINPNPDDLLAYDILTKMNTNESWNNPEGLLDPKFVAFNGSIGDKQLEWLEQELEHAALNDQVVILAGHIPILRSSENKRFILWNSDEVVEIIERYPCVKAYFCGHYHGGGILQTNQFIQVNMPGIVESLHGESRYGIVEMTKQSLHLPAISGSWNEIIFQF